MPSFFVTGSSQANLAANITAAITAGKSDITIYGVTPALIGSNINNLIPNLNLLKALRFSDDVAALNNAFVSANFSNLSLLSVVPTLNSMTFQSAQLNALTQLDLSKLTSLVGTDHFSAAQMNALKTINLSSLTSWPGAGTFSNAQLNALTFLGWPATLPSMPSFTFNNATLPKLPGICLSKNTTFTTGTFFSIAQGPSDMKVLDGKTNNHVVYASDFYGYACAPLAINIPVSNSDSVFGTYAYKNFAGTVATGLTVTAVNEITSFPVTIGSITIQSNGTITVNSDGPTTFTMRFAATGPSSLIGARTVRVNPFFSLSKLGATKSIDRVSGKGGVSIKGVQNYIQQPLSSRTMTMNAYGKTISSTLASDGSFSFFHPASDFESTQRCSATLSHPSTGQSTFNFLLVPQKVPATLLSMKLLGSFADTQLILPSDFASASSDKNEIFSDLCAFAQTQPSDRINAIFQTLENSDLFISGSVIEKGSFDVFVSCSDQCLHIDEVENLFAFELNFFASDEFVEYSDNNPSHFISDHPVIIESISTQMSDKIIFDSVEITPPIVPCASNLSDIQFFAISANDFMITGYQSHSLSEPRTVSASYLDAPIQTQNFNADGFFQFSFANTPISDGELVTIVTEGSNCGFSVATITSQSQTIAQGTLGASFLGSLLSFNLILPPELTLTLPVTSDVHVIFSDVCAFAQLQDCRSFLAGIVINAYSDLFCSDAVIVQHPEVVIVSCSDNVLHLDDDDGHFTFSITNFMSDSILLQYNDAFCAVSDSMSLIGGSFSLQTSDTNFVWVIPCDSDVPNIFTNVFSHPLLAIDAQGDVVDIGLIDCSGPCNNPTSDLLYVSQLKAASLRLGQYLSEHYSDYTSKISDQSHVLYLGPIKAGLVTVDLETARLIFSNFVIPFSDIDICL